MYNSNGGGVRLSQSPSHDFFRFWCARFISGVLRFSIFFLSCLYIVSFPKILASLLLASLRGSTCNGANKPVNDCEVIRFAPLQDSPFINRICPTSRWKHQDHQNHHLPLVLRSCEPVFHFTEHCLFCKKSTCLSENKRSVDVFPVRTS